MGALWSCLSLGRAVWSQIMLLLRAATSMYLSPATSIQTIIISLLSYHNSFLSWTPCLFLPSSTQVLFIRKHFNHVTCQPLFKTLLWHHHALGIKPKPPSQLTEPYEMSSPQPPALPSHLGMPFLTHSLLLPGSKGFPGGPVVKNSPAGDTGLIPGPGRPIFCGATKPMCLEPTPRVRALQQEKAPQ